RRRGMAPTWRARCRPCGRRRTRPWSPAHCVGSRTRLGADRRLSSGGPVNDAATAQPEAFSRRTTKLAVVGAGAVGSTLAYAALMRGAARTVALYDVNAAKVQAEALDLSHGVQFVPEATVVGSDDISVCADADVVVVTAGAKQRPGQSRIDLAEA